MKKYPLAISFLEKAMTLKPDFENAIRLRSSLIEKMGKKNDLIRIPVSVSPSVYGKWYMKADECIKSGKYEDALVYYDKAIEERPNWSLPLMEKGVTLVFLKRYDEAVDCLNKANKIRPNDEDILDNLGAALIMAKRYEESLKISDKSLLLNSHNFKPWLNKGIAYQRAGNPEESIEYLLEARKLNPKELRITNNLILSYEAMRNYGEALKFCDELLKIYPNKQYYIQKKNEFTKKISEKNKNKPKIEIIEKLLIDMSTKYSRIHIDEIAEKSGISDKNIIRDTIMELIMKKNIVAKYFESSEFVVFEVAPTTKEIDEFMATYKEKDDKKL